MLGGGRVQPLYYNLFDPAKPIASLATVLVKEADRRIHRAACAAKMAEETGHE